jgi:hypothetical protein
VDYTELINITIIIIIIIIKYSTAATLYIPETWFVSGI